MRLCPHVLVPVISGCPFETCVQKRKGLRLIQGTWSLGSQDPRNPETFGGSGDILVSRPAGQRYGPGLLSLKGLLSTPPQPSPAQPSPAQPSPAQPSPAQPSPAQPSPAQHTPPTHPTPPHPPYPTLSHPTPPHPPYPTLSHPTPPHPPFHTLPHAPTLHSYIGFHTQATRSTTKP